MNTIYRLLSVILIPLTLIIISHQGRGEGEGWLGGYIINPSIAYAEEKITTHIPETVETEPVELPKPVKKSGGFGWGSLLLIVLVAGGVAAAAGGGGGTSSSSSGGGGGGGTGTYNVTW